MNDNKYINEMHELGDADKTQQNREELKERLVNLERNLGKLKAELKAITKGYRDQIKDVQNEIDGTMEQL